MLERERELAVCLAALNRARAGQGGFVLVEGSAGIGKTELIRAFRARACEARVLSARGLEVGRQLAFGGVRQLFEPVFRTAEAADVDYLLSGSAAPARWLLGEVSTPSVVSADPTFAMLNALYWVIARLSDA